MYKETFIKYDRGGVEGIEEGLQKVFTHPKEGSKNIVGLGGRGERLRKFCILQNEQITSSYRLDGFQLNNLMTCPTQLYHIVCRYNKCSLSNYYTVVHPKNFQKLEMLYNLRV